MIDYYTFTLVTCPWGVAL